MSRCHKVPRFEQLIESHIQYISDPAVRLYRLPTCHPCGSEKWLVHNDSAPALRRTGKVTIRSSTNSHPPRKRDAISRLVRGNQRHRPWRCTPRSKQSVLGGLQAHHTQRTRYPTLSAPILSTLRLRTPQYHHHNHNLSQHPLSKTRLPIRSMNRRVPSRQVSMALRS